MDSFYADTQMFGIHFMPIWAYTLSSYVKEFKNLKTILFDSRFEKIENVKRAELFCFTGINQDFDAIMINLNFLSKKFKNAKFIIGGPITRSFQHVDQLSKLSKFDHILIGDGESIFKPFIQNFINGKKNKKIIEAQEKFDLKKSEIMDHHLIDSSIGKYYGAIIEVSRGCPFLCEFCDIRTLPFNNRSHTKDPDLIIKELDYFASKGVGQILFACDNFIGNHVWAEEVCDGIISWRKKTGYNVSLYTWLTINLSSHSRLLSKLRNAGFDMFFIGVESFHKNSLLETAKLQNSHTDMIKAIGDIQSYGFIVVAGLIIGFDTEPDDIVEINLDGILQSGLISGDISLLTALAGTPLYTRMKLASRLRNKKFGLGGFKYQTNIKYIRNAQKIKNDFKKFSKVFNNPEFQYKRLKNYFENIDNANFINSRTGGYANIIKLCEMTFKNFKSIHLLLYRLFLMISSPIRCYYIFKAFFLTLKMGRKGHSHMFYFKFWFFNWSNSMVKYSSLKESDFDIESIERKFKKSDLLPTGYMTSIEPNIPLSKVKAQRKNTSMVLSNFMK